MIVTNVKIKRIDEDKYEKLKAYVDITSTIVLLSMD